MLSKQQQLINKVKPELPITVYPERLILPGLKDNFNDDSITLSTELEVHSMVDMMDEGGIVCEIRLKGMDSEQAESVFLCSITHFRVKKGEPFYKELEMYRIRRIRKLKKSGNNRRF